MAGGNVRVVWVNVMMIVAAVVLVIAVFALQEASQMATALTLVLYMTGLIVLAFAAELAAVSAESKQNST
jgi:uncharacterized membrane protein